MKKQRYYNIEFSLEIFVNDRYCIIKEFIIMRKGINYGFFEFRICDMMYCFGNFEKYIKINNKLKICYWYDIIVVLRRMKYFFIKCYSQKQIFINF